MELKISHVFTVKLNSQIEFIAQHRPNVARKFKVEVFKALKSIPKSPLKHRKSIFFDSADIRDLVIKNHIVVYKIDKEKNQILVFGLVYNQGVFSFLFILNEYSLLDFSSKEKQPLSGWDKSFALFLYHIETVEHIAKKLRF